MPPRIWLRIPSELEPIPYTRGTTQLPNHDLARWQDEREDAAHQQYGQHDNETHNETDSAGHCDAA